MLRIGRAVVAVLIAAGVVLVPGAAQAAGGLPDPVGASSLLPSTTVRLTQGASGTWSVGDYLRAFSYANRSNSLATIPKPASIPVTGPAASWGTKLLAGANAVGAAFAGGFAVGGAGVSLYGTITGTEVDAPMCGLADWAQVGYGLLTLGMGPSCKAPINGPNSDVSEGWMIAGTTVSTFTRQHPDNVVQYDRLYMCAARAQLPVGQAIQVSTLTATGVSAYANLGFGATSADCGWSGTGGYSGYSANTKASGAGFPSLVGVRLVQGATVLETGTQSSADPLRDSACTLTWPGGSTTTGFVGQYRESEGFPVGAVSAACTEAYVSKPGAGPDLLPERISVGSRNTETGSETEIADQEVPDYSEAERKGLDAGDGTGLKLWKISNGVKASCMTWAADCKNWWTDTGSGTDESVGADKYRCEFGGKKVALAECGIYRRTFDDQTEETKIADPESGEDREWFNETDGRGSTNPGAGLDPSGECFAQGWATVANPIEWVLVPVKCALVWAFVPRTPVIESAVAGIGNAAGNVQLVDPLMTLLAELPSSSGCDGLPLELTFFGQEWDGRLLEACTGEAAAAATVVNGLMTLALVTGSVLAIARYAAAVFGFVGPGGSIEQAQRGAEVQQRQSGKAGS